MNGIEACGRQRSAGRWNKDGHFPVIDEPSEQCLKYHQNNY
jgi:hypothetical protein